MISTVRARILLGLIIPLLLMAAGVASVAVWKMRETAETGFATKATQELMLFTAYINKLVAVAEANGLALVKAPGMAEGLGMFANFKDETIDKEYRHSDLSPQGRAYIEPLIQMEKAHEDYSQIFIGFADGSYATSLERTVVPAGRNMARRAWYVEAEQKPQETSISTVYINIKNIFVATVTCKIRDAAGKLAGILGIDLSLEDLTKLAEKMKVGETGRFILIEQTGRILCSPRVPELVGKMLGKDVQHEGLSYLLKQPNGVYRLTMGNQPAMAVSATTPFGWKLIYAENESEIFQEANNAVYVIFAVSLAITAVMIFLGFLLARSINKPLSLVVDYANAVAEGNLDASVKKEYFYGELRQLHEALAHMINNLRQFIAEANQQAEESKRQTEIAQQAVKEAEEARQRAEYAKREGMLNAAQQLSESISIISSASQELARQVEHSSEGAEQQAERATETATAMNEMNATVAEVARNASDAAEMSNKMRQCAGDGATIVRHVVHGIDDVHTISLELKNDMAQLGESAKAITQIMSVISDIADQTNLLALNAAIEAARAGEAGRGFAVVADEVRKLAEKTMTSTSEVGNAIAAIRNNTEKSIHQVEIAVESISRMTEFSTGAGKALEEIVQMAEHSADGVRAIAAASEEQSATSEEINRSVADINEIANETSHNMQQASHALTELARHARHLEEVVEEMKRA